VRGFFTEAMNMNADLSPDHPDLACGVPLERDWRAASAAYHSLFGDEQQPVVSGEIWTVRDRADDPDEELLLVVVMAVTGDAVRVVPLSSEVRSATEWDLFLPAATLGYRAIAQPKLAGTVALNQLDQRLSSLMPESAQNLTELATAADAGVSIPPEHLPLGPWVLTERDERLTARACTADRLQGYLTLALADPMAEWRSLGAILVRGSRASGVDLAIAVGDPGQAEQLRADRLNLFEALPPRKMAQLLAALRIGWTERVRDAIYRLAAQLTPTDVAYTPVLGRRRRKRERSGRGRQTQRQRDRAAGDYVDAVERELSGL
jgi:hypothetical protein